MIKYKVTLTQEERAELEEIISKGRHSSQVYRNHNAYMLLNCDEGHLGIRFREGDLPCVKGQHTDD